jgi:hypothetical protein
VHRNPRLDAIPAAPARLRGSGLFPFGYETDPALIRAILADYARALATERLCLAWALKHGRSRIARQSRAFIDQVELRRRNGEARLRLLATARSEPG